MPVLASTVLPDDVFDHVLAVEQIDTSVELWLDEDENPATPDTLIAVGRSLNLGWIIIGEDTLFWNACVSGGQPGAGGAVRWVCY